MEAFERELLSPLLTELIDEMQGEYADWVPLAKLGGEMGRKGISYKNHGISEAQTVSG